MGGAVDDATLVVVGLSALPGAVGTQIQSFHCVNSQVTAAERVNRAKILTCRLSVIGAPKRGGCRAAAPPQLKKIHICRHDDIKGFA